MRFAYFIFGILLLVPSARALPDAPKPKPVMWRVGSAMLAGSAAYDWYTTADLRSRGGYEIGSSWAIGRYPSNRKIVAFGSAWTAAEMIGFHYTERSKRRWLRWAGRAYVAWAIEDHIRSGLHNERLDTGLRK